jgi:hydroxyethylthiazole kinase
VVGVPFGAWTLPNAATVLINVGTVTNEAAKAMLVAAAAARESGTPWVLDPDPCDFERRSPRDCSSTVPAIVRGNASEILALSGFAGGGKGVDSTDDSSAAIPFARELAKRTGAVVAISGVLDYITDGSDVISVAGGDAIMTRVTGVGCALGALMAAFLATANPLGRRVSVGCLCYRR